MLLHCEHGCHPLEGACQVGSRIPSGERELPDDDSFDLISSDDLSMGATLRINSLHGCHGCHVHIYTFVLARISHRVLSRGRRGAVPSGFFDPRGAERVLAVRRAPRGEKRPLGAMHRRSQQEAGEICGLGPGSR